MSFLNFFKKKNIAPDESDRNAAAEFWNFFFNEISPFLLNIVLRLENVGESCVKSCIDEFETISFQAEERLWVMLPKIKDKLFFSPVPALLINGKLDIHIWASKGYGQFVKLLAGSMPYYLTDKWQIEEL